MKSDTKTYSSKKKGLITMPASILEEVEKVRRGFELGSRVGTTKLGRSTQWRKDLKRLSVMEVVDRNETAAILLKPETFKAIISYLDQMDEELEQKRVEALFEHRKHQNDWQTGESLAEKAKARLQERELLIRGLLDGDNE